MLEIVTGESHGNCEGGSRREFLRIGTLGIGGVGLSSLLSAQVHAARNGSVTRDKSIVVLFLTGGPSQIETFDPKMAAPAEYRSVTGALPSKVPGVAFGGTFPRLAGLADKMAVVRSFTHGQSGHTEAVQQVIRGGNPVNHAGMGSIVSRLRGTSHPDTGMPTHVYVSSSEVDKQFNKERLRLLDAAGPGDMGGAYGPFQVGGDSQASGDMQLRISRARLDDRLALNKALDQLNRQLDARGSIESLDKFAQQALEFVLGKSRAAFDLTQESPALVERYDTSQFVTGIHADRPSTLGKQMLLARRLCEAGCGFVTIHNPGWDMHGGNTQLNMPGGMEELGRPVDHAVSAFLEDVESRGLSDKILLIITGEFGRTPRVKDNGGRDHWPRLSTLAFAGGGLRMGQAIGQSTAKAEEPRTAPITLDNLFATVMHVLFDVPKLRTQARLPREIVTLLERSKPIHELL
ncbi:MAG: hypothetical protein CMJ64_23255 [Planctomycetaceae bacterium]|nr:hypothetical protein [Planctomycetaceae bacterium]